MKGWYLVAAIFVPIFPPLGLVIIADYLASKATEAEGLLPAYGVPPQPANPEWLARARAIPWDAP